MAKHTERPLHRRSDPHNLPLEQAREMFLNAYAGCQPAVLSELAEAPLEAFRHERAGRTEDMWDKVCCSPKFPGLTRSLQAWAGKFHLHAQGEPAQWVMATALSTLSSWSESPKDPQTRRKRLRKPTCTWSGVGDELQAWVQRGACRESIGAGGRRRSRN